MSELRFLQEINILQDWCLHRMKPEPGAREMTDIITAVRSIPPGGVSETFRVKIDTMDSEDDFNVIVVQECTAVLYDEKGNPYADWTRIADSSEESYQGEGGGE